MALTVLPDDIIVTTSPLAALGFARTSRIIGEPLSSFTSPTALPEPFDIVCGVDVAILNEPAMRTVVDANAERLRHDGIAAAAPLRRTTWIHSEELSPGALCLGLEDRCELRPRGVENLFRETRAGEASNVELFDGDRVESLNEIESNLVLEVEACSTDAVVALGEQLDCFAPSSRTTLASSDAALRKGKRPLRRFVDARIRDHLAVAERGKGRDSNVDPDALSGRGQRLGGHVVASESDVPMTIARKRHRGLLDAPLSRSMKLDLDAPNTSELDPLTTGAQSDSVAPPSVLERECSITSAPLEPWESRPLTRLNATEESSVCAIESRDCVLQKVRVHRGELWPHDANFAKLGLLGVAGELDSRAVRRNAFLQARVVKLAQHLQGSAHRRLLGAGRVKPIAVDAEHVVSVRGSLAAGHAPRSCDSDAGCARSITRAVVN